ncbi:hypothetical protein SAMN02745704_00094 [Paucidesulfovibrio gracilis DSM 16080]|uniref:Uncharacterized protein n=1 Tax=Paucidesulfovibrio gracilis DSM 16080 TaxID=1121449 RepID=A0A1T4W231_9BACT|nr:hypothetical protein [Paucidesulfovibrio gracilis]SKA71199.1 hypothetical protein SAMN02745704_00094 [Paucidesulfovibrio gracilis DSM 16080]
MAKKNESKRRIVESKYDAPLLRQLCEEGADAQTAKKKLGLASLQSLRTHLMRLSVEDNQLRTLPGLYERSNSRVRVTKHGIKITLKKLEAIEGDFQINSEFTIEVDEDNRIILSPVTAAGPDDEEEAPESDGEA